MARRWYPSKPASIHEVSPSRLAERESLTYEVIAACCVTETESAGVLTTLLASEPDPPVREVLHAIARDEVDHSRLGWAHLAHARTVQKLDYMAELLPIILGGTVPDSLFQPAADDALESPLLLRAGILPHTQKRSVFVRMLREVVFPGLESQGLDTSVRQGLARRAGVDEQVSAAAAEAAADRPSAAEADSSPAAARLAAASAAAAHTGAARPAERSAALRWDLSRG